MKVMIIGGTGFLGYHASLEFLARGHEVATLSLPDVALGHWFPAAIQVQYGDVFSMTDRGLAQALTGYDALVYAVGPDDRVTPPAPAYPFFHARLVDASAKVIAAAREAGIRRSVVLNSYFATFDRTQPQKKLAERHPYIRCRVEQAERVIAEGQDRMDVMILELPYIFGAMPGRVPLWKDVLFERLRKPKVILYPKGGTNMIAVEHVAEAIVGAVERGIHGKRYPVGDVNLSWNGMIQLILHAMGTNKPVINIPRFLAVQAGKQMQEDHAKKGLESGLDPVWLMKDIMTDEFFFDPSESRQELGYRSGGIETAIEKTVYASYPEDFL
ncbi:MAG: NAD(P)H-binding protein [Anaerolineae bacterium]|nr:NAD(P)H-binding protein [Anaerolineae bacterium]